MPQKHLAENQGRKWLVQFIHEITGILVYIDHNVHPDDIKEWGAEKTTGILESYPSGEIKQIEFPELYQLANTASSISSADRDTYKKAWKAVERKAQEIKRQLISKI